MAIKTHFSCTYTFFVVPSDAALALPIPPKVRSHDAEHTPRRSHFFEKHGFAF